MILSVNFFILKIWCFA